MKKLVVVLMLVSIGLIWIGGQVQAAAFEKKTPAKIGIRSTTCNSPTGRNTPAAWKKLLRLLVIHLCSPTRNPARKPRSPARWT